MNIIVGVMLKVDYINSPVIYQPYGDNSPIELTAL